MLNKSIFVSILTDSLFLLSSTVDQNDEDLTKDSKQLKIEEWEKENQIVVDGTTVKHPDDEEQIKPLNDIHVELPENDNPKNVDDGEQYEGDYFLFIEKVKCKNRILNRQRILIFRRSNFA